MRLRDRYHHAKRLLAHLTDVRGHIAEHPLPAVGIAFAVGLYAGLRSRARGGSAVHHALTDAVASAVGSVLIALARDAVLRDARVWLEREDELRVH